jgi:hypothetical protein
MSSGRSAERNVHIYHSDDLAKPLGGLVVTNGITYANFYAMVEVFLFFSSPFVLRHEDVTDSLRDIPRDEQPLQPGIYYVITEGEKLPCVHGQAFVELQAGSIEVNDERWLVRAISLASGSRVASFRDAVRERDRRCVVTGTRATRAQYGFWTGFQAAHIFPLAYEEHWKDSNYGQWITIPPATESAGSINSVQNGMLLRNDIHAHFDSYDFSINPDVCIIHFFKSELLIFPGQLQDCLLHN